MAEPLIYLQNTFDGGLNQQVDGSRVAANEFPLLINGRHRNDIIEQINGPIDQTPVGITNIQGCYAAGNYSVLFANGLAYYKNESVAGAAYVQIAGFQMSALVPVIYACAVPASTINSVRKAVSTNTRGGITLTGSGASSPQALVVQDGINQPYLILSDGSARVTQVYNNWTQDNREYVPIGQQMLYQDGILYIVSPDGSQVYRSVTGRPCDFMVIIDTNGDKLPSESEGGAAAVSFKVDFAPITTIAPLSSPDGSFYVSTARTSYAVTPDLTQTVYGEPQFRSTFLFTTGAVNNFSVCDILGDTALIDSSGIRSFNSVSQYRFEGKNSPFGLRIGGLTDDIKQVNAACITHNNYALFYASTVFGDGIVVFDTTTNKWVSLDLLSILSTEAVIMFCEIKTDISRKLLCVTKNHVLELYPETGTTEYIGYYTPEFNSNDPRITQKLTYLNLGFVNVTTSGTVFTQLIEDGKVGVTRSSRVRNVPLGNPTRAIPPVVHGSKDSARNVTVALLDVAKSCWKCGLFIRWNFKGSLNSIKVFSNPENVSVSFEEQASINAGDIQINAAIYGTDLGPGSIVDIFGSGLACLNSVTVNSTSVTQYTIISDNWVRLYLPDSYPVGSTLLIIEVVSCSGSSYVWSPISNQSGLPVDNSELGVWILPGVIPVDPADPGGTYGNISPWIGPKAPRGIDPVDPTACAATVPFQPTAMRVTDMSGRGVPNAYVFNITAYLPTNSNVSAAELVFTKNADGSYTYLSPVITYKTSAGYVSQNPGLLDYGTQYNGNSGIVPFSVGDISICVDFGATSGGGGGATADPCTGSYPAAVTIECTVGVHTVSALCSKVNVGGVDRFVGSGTLGVIPVKLYALKDYHSFPSWVLVCCEASLNPYTAGQNNYLSFAGAGTVVGCGPPVSGSGLAGSGQWETFLVSADFSIVA